MDEQVASKQHAASAGPAGCQVVEAWRECPIQHLEMPKSPMLLLSVWRWVLMLLMLLLLLLLLLETMLQGHP